MQAAEVIDLGAYRLSRAERRLAHRPADAFQVAQPGPFFAWVPVWFVPVYVVGGVPAAVAQ